MKIIQYLLLFSCFLLQPLSNHAQVDTKKFNGHLRTGGLLNFTDINQNTYQGNKPDVFVSGGLAYRIDVMDADLVGDLLFGTLDGNTDTTFFNTVFYDMSLNVRFDIMKWIAQTKLEVRPMLGVGLLFYASKKYDLESRNLIAESPIYQEKSLSPNPSVNIGAEITYPILQNLDLAVGYNHKVIFGNDYFDGESFDKPFDKIGLIHAGFVFGFGGQSGNRNRNSKKIKPENDIVQLTHEEYASLVYRIDSLQRKLANMNPGEVEKLRSKVDEQAGEIDSMNVVIDSLRAGVINLFPNDTNAMEGVGDAHYRLVLTSMETKAEAQAYIDRAVNLEQDKMVIMKIPDENRYLIFYKNFDNLMKARKEKGVIKGFAPRAWIARL